MPIPTTPNQTEKPPPAEQDIITISDSQATPKKPTKNKRRRSLAEESRGAESPARKQSKGKERALEGNNPTLVPSKHKVFPSFILCCFRMFIPIIRIPCLLLRTNAQVNVPALDLLSKVSNILQSVVPALMRI